MIRMRVVPLFLCLLPLGVTAQGGLKGSSGISYSLEDLEPNPPLSSVPDPALGGQVTRNFISATLGSNMVLQRDEETILWGYTQQGATITTSLHDDGETAEQARLELTTTAEGDDGLWRQTLPPQPASLKPSAITIKSTTGEKHTLENVLFGDVYICGGQSNMQFSLPQNTNGTEEAANGENYKHIRVFTVGQGTSSNTPLPDLQTVEEKWSVAGKDSLLGPSKRSFSYFSSVCWFFGKEISEGLDNKVPLGLISNNWGGTPVEKWVPGGPLYNAMIHPYMVGPMKLTGFTWYQGEANAGGQKAADSYAERFPSMIESWRKGFQVPGAYFGFVQLSTWCPGHPLVVPELRQAQMAALKLGGKVGYATNADHGAGCNIHPPPKQYCGYRLGNSALALQYGKQIHWQSPSYVGGKTALGTTSGQTASIVIELKDVSSKGLYLLDTPYNLLPEANMDCDKKPEGTCEGANVLLNGKGWVKASISIQDNNHVVFTASEGDGSDSIVATSYGWGSVPLMTLYDAGTKLPVLPWNEKV